MQSLTTKESVVSQGASTAPAAVAARIAAIDERVAAIDLELLNIRQWLSTIEHVLQTGQPLPSGTPLHPVSSPLSPRE